MKKTLIIYKGVCRALFISLVASVMCMASCSGKTKSEKPTYVDTDVKKEIMDFNADSAYKYVDEQVKFGARVPNTPAHVNTGVYLSEMLGKWCDTVIIQSAKLKAFDGTQLNAKNIIGEINPDKERRILLLAHWDSRPWADNDPDASKHKQPVLGANDGASGVGVLLEIARILHEKRPEIGIDIMFVDAEDWGDTSASYDTESTWALGTQYWAANMHRPNYRPQYGILLDMVGARGAKFYKEYHSMNYAAQVTNMVWNEARKAGYGEFFINENGGAISDDHVFVNRAGIPCVDIIDQNGEGGNSGFFPAWHTTHDTMSNISTATLKAVGQTVINIIYSYHSDK